MVYKDIEDKQKEKEQKRNNNQNGNGSLSDIPDLEELNDILTDFG